MYWIINFDHQKISRLRIAIFDNFLLLHVRRITKRRECYFYAILISEKLQKSITLKGNKFILEIGIFFGNLQLTKKLK